MKIKEKAASFGRWFWNHKVISALILLALFFAVFLLFKGGGKPRPEILTEEPAARRDIQKVITGTATLSPKDSYTITSLISGEISADYFEEGDTVKEGDLLYRIDAKDARQSVESADLSVRRAQNGYQSAVREKNNLTVTAPSGGKIQSLLVTTGDTVNAGSPIAKIYDDTTMELSVPFNEGDANAIYPGEAAEVRISGSGMTLWGTVKRVSNTATAGSGYSLTKTVTVSVKNPGAVTPNDQATCMIGAYACQSAGSFSYISEDTVTAKTAGKVSSLPVKEGDFVSAGSVVALLTSDTIDDTIRQNALSVEEASLARRQAGSRLSDYDITAPISGTVIEKNVKAGDNLSNTGAQTAMAIIYDMSELTFTLSIDELDVKDIHTGQTVNFTVDALDGAGYQGTVTKVSVNGTTQNSVTVYPVEVTVTQFDEKLLPGMNIDASIVVEEAKDALSVPVSALYRGNVVYVKGEKTEADDEAPEGYYTRHVEVGISDDYYIEIKNGLSEGEVVYALPQDTGPSVIEQMMEGRSGGGGMQKPHGDMNFGGGGKEPTPGNGGGM